MLLSELMALAEGKEMPVTLYIEAFGTWERPNGGILTASVVYPVDVPAESVDKIVKHFHKDDNGLDPGENVDRFEQDGWAPARANTGHAETIEVLGASSVPPAKTKKMKNNYYTMVFALRDLKLISQQYAESIAKH